MIKKSSIIFVFCFLLLACNSKFLKINKAENYKTETFLCDTSNFDLFKIFTEESITRFQREIDIYAEKDAIQMPPDSCVLFVGSSSIRKWHSLEEEFINLQAVNRGFGGSTFPELIYYADELIFKYNPSKIVVYEGDNDQYFMSPYEIFENACYLEKIIHKKLPNTDLYFLSAKPSPSRREKIRSTVQTNEYLEEIADNCDKTFYINVWDSMFDENSNIRSDIFKKDSLHLNDKGYKIWFDIIYPILN